MKIILCNIIQTYIQSKTEFNCMVICYLPVELKKKYPEDTILCIVKPLYGLAEAGNHCFATYLNYQIEKQSIKISSYNTCLLITKDRDKNFGIIRLQTNNILNITIKIFINKEEIEIIKAKFNIKSQIRVLEITTLADFHNCHIIIENKFIVIV